MDMEMEPLEADFTGSPGVGPANKAGGFRLEAAGRMR
jgi:hypothetical protein